MERNFRDIDRATIGIANRKAELLWNWLIKF